MDNPCNNISSAQDANYNDTRQYLAVLDSNHDMSQGRQDADLRDHSRAAAAALMRNNPLDAGMIGPDLIHDDVQRELRGAVTQFTNGKFTSIGGVAGRSYERHVLSELFQDPMATSFQKLLRDSEAWSLKKKPERTASPHIQHTGYKNQAEKDADLLKPDLIGDEETRDMINNSPIGTQPLLQSNNCSWGSISITWEDDTNAVRKPNGDYYYTMDLFNGSGLKRVAGFMMEFMYPETRVERGGLVIDGGSAGALRILEALPQIQSIVCPAVVGDSAALCWHNIGGKGKERNFCCFPTSNQNNIPNGPEQFIEKSNVSSDGFEGFNTQFYYERPSGTIYDKNNYNVFSFNLRVSGNGVDVLGTFQFTRSGPSMGPTVGYLAQLLNAARSSADAGYDAMIIALQSVAPTGSVLRLNGFPSDLMSALKGNVIPVDTGLQLFERICFDIKRCGDWEQVESVSAVEKHDPSVGTAMLGTGDILCMAQARLKGECGAWHTETASDPTGWEIILFRNPKNVSEDQVKFFKMKDIVGVLIVPLTIINNNSLGLVFGALTSTIAKCNVSIKTLCEDEDAVTPAKAISATNLANVVRQCINTQMLLAHPVMPDGTDTVALLELCRKFKNTFDPALAQQGKEEDLAVVVEQFAGLLTDPVDELVTDLSPFVEKVRTALYSIGLGTAEVEDVCELGNPVEDATTVRIFGQPEETPTNIDGTINENWIIDNMFNYFAGWHTNIVSARDSIGEIINVTMTAINIDGVDVSSAPAVASLVTAFNDTLDQLKPYMSASSEYIKAITRSTASCPVDLIRDINRMYKLKSLSNLAVPSRVEGGRRSASPEDLVRIRDGVAETRNLIQAWWGDGEQFATVIARMLLADDEDLGGGGSNRMKGGKRSSPSTAEETYEDAVANYFDMLIQEVIGYLKLCDDAYGLGTPEAAATRAEGFYQAKYSFCKGIILDSAGRQLLYGPKLPEDKVDLLRPYLNDENPMSPIRVLQTIFGDCDAAAIMGGVNYNNDNDGGVMVDDSADDDGPNDDGPNDDGPNGQLGSGDTNGFFPRHEVVSQWVANPIEDENMNMCIKLRHALNVLWSDSGIEVARDAYEVAMLQDTNNSDLQLPHPPEDADIGWFIREGGSFVERAVYSVVDMQDVPTAFSSSQWQRENRLTKTMGIAAGHGLFGLTSTLWTPVMEYLSVRMAGDIEKSRNILSDIDELVNESFGSYNYESPVDDMITTVMEINQRYKLLTRGREEDVDDGAGAANQTQGTNQMEAPAANQIQGANQMGADALLAAQLQHMEDMEEDVAPTVAAPAPGDAEVRETKRRRVNLRLVQPQQHPYDIDYGEALVNMFYPNANANANVPIPQMVTAFGGKKKKNTVARRTKKKAKKRKTTRKKSFTGKKRKARNQKKKKTTKKKNKKKKKTRYNRK
jgi:hypothetical protein